jgi:hypothetical protein
MTALSYLTSSSEISVPETNQLQGDQELLLALTRSDDAPDRKLVESGTLLALLQGGDNNLKEALADKVQDLLERGR